jgi:hypothetical protein
MTENTSMSESITMWRVNWSRQIERVECSKVTKKSVFLVVEPAWDGKMHRFSEPQRKNIGNNYHSYHRTWGDAHAALLKSAEDNLNSARLQLAMAQGEHGRIKGMKPPAGMEARS